MVQPALTATFDAFRLVLLRAYDATRDEQYQDATQRVFQSLLLPVEKGGVLFVDEHRETWIEEYLVDPPTHILNGLIWAVWGVYDYSLASNDPAPRKLFDDVVRTLTNNLKRYDMGFWSLYEQSGTRLPMVASPFYHQLHVVQLRVMHQLTGEDTFARYADRWESYARSRTKRTRALCYKSAFKFCYY